MKIKKIGLSVLLIVEALVMYACTNHGEVDAVFTQNPTERLTARKKELKDALESAEYGWKAIYFTDTTMLGGYTHLFKFKNGIVEMASDFDEDTSIHKSEYTIELGSTVSLVFATWNRINLLGNPYNTPLPMLKGAGYKGDLQFLYYGQEKDQIHFKTNKYFTDLLLIKATPDDWTNLPKNFSMAHHLEGTDKSLYTVLEINDGTKSTQYQVNYFDPSRFAKLKQPNSFGTSSFDWSIGLMATGIMVRPALKIGNQKLSEFIYDASTGNFRATGTNGVTATIKYPKKPLIVTDDYKVLLNNNNLIQLKFEVAGEAFPAVKSNAKFMRVDSPLAILEVEKLEAIFREKGYRLMDIRMGNYFDKKRPEVDNYISYAWSDGGQHIKLATHFFKVIADSNSKILHLVPEDRWEGNSVEEDQKLFAEFEKNLFDEGGYYFKNVNNDIPFELKGSFYTLSSVSKLFRIFLSDDGDYTDPNDDKNNTDPVDGGETTGDTIIGKH